MEVKTNLSILILRKTSTRNSQRNILREKIVNWFTNLRKPFVGSVKVFHQWYLRIHSIVTSLSFEENYVMKFYVP